MKRILLFLLPLTALLSCHSDHKKANNDTLNKTNAGTNQVLSKETLALIGKFKPIIQGVWVKADYLEKIKETKSPLAASSFASWITTLFINCDSIKGDELKVLAGYGNHDSGDVTIKFEHGKKPETILFDDHDLSYTISNGDTVLFLPQFDERKKIYFSRKYVRVLSKQPTDNFGYGIYLAVNKAVIAGNYLFTDTLGNKKKVRFNDDGKLIGFPDFYSYQINIDFNDLYDNLDVITLQGKIKHFMSYSFKINADTLNLYTTKENADSISLSIDKLKYKLVREKP